MAKWLIRLLVWIIDRYYFGPPMSAFKTALITEAVRGGWELQQELIYYSDYLQKDIRVPLKFFTDLASVPWLARWLVPVANAKNRRAAVLHDYLCDPIVQKALKITQSEADYIGMVEANEVCGLTWVERRGMWLPVRCYQAIKGIFK